MALLLGSLRLFSFHSAARGEKSGAQVLPGTQVVFPKSRFGGSNTGRCGYLLVCLCVCSNVFHRSRGGGVGSSRGFYLSSEQRKRKELTADKMAPFSLFHITRAATKKSLESASADSLLL